MNWGGGVQPNNSNRVKVWKELVGCISVEKVRTERICHYAHWENKCVSKAQLTQVAMRRHCPTIPYYPLLVSIDSLYTTFYNRVSIVMFVRKVW